MRILVVDDEKMIRKGIVQILSSAFPEETFLEANNGQNALEMYHSAKPDLLITDIKMPVMDGIDLMKAVRREDSEISIIVVTGFDDFDYARTALRCGASAYILKPIEKSELLETVEQIVSEKRLSAKGKAERLLARSYADGGMTRETRESLSFLCPYRVAAFLNPTQSILEKVYCISPVNHGYIAIIRVAEDIPEPFPPCWVGLSQEKDSFDDLQEGALEAMSALYGRFLGSGSRIIISTGIGEIPANDIAEAVSRISGQLGYASASDIEKNISLLFTVPSKCDGRYYLFSASEALKNSILSKNSLADPLLQSRLTSLAAYSSLGEWKSDLLAFLVKANEERREALPENSFVTKALSYIEENYSRNINRAVVSNEVGISYTYFSEKFKECMKINFNDYLTAFRVKKAKELLAKGCYRIYEVSEKCGFSGPRYFIKIFKQATGVTPTAYMTSHSGE